MIQPAKILQANESPSLASVLHDCLASGVILIDAEKRVAWLSDCAGQLLDLTPDSAKPPAFADLPEALQAMAGEALLSGKAPADQEIESKTGSRGAFTLRLSAIPLRAGGKNSGVVIVLNDLTPARQIEQHIQQFDRLASLGTLAASMAHEIKNALVAGKTFVDLLLEKHQGVELVEVVRREMSRIDAIVSRMLKSAGPARPAYSQVRLHEVLEHSLRLIQPQLEEKSVSLSRSFQASPDALHGDDYQLQQAVVNLLLNALDAMGPNGKLSVTTDILSPGSTPANLAGSAARAQLRLTIKDNGIGIPPENMARLFEPFFTTKPNGTGLGLLITRRIIQEHHGAITVQSEPHQGTAFQILLPASASPIDAPGSRAATYRHGWHLHARHPERHPLRHRRRTGPRRRLRAAGHPQSRSSALSPAASATTSGCASRCARTISSTSSWNAAAAFDYVIANGDYSCNTAFVGLSDDAACQSARECLGKLRQRFGARLRANYGDHELGKITLFGAHGGMRLASWRRAREELGLQPFWRLRPRQLCPAGHRLLARRAARLRGRHAAGGAARMGTPARRTPGGNSPTPSTPCSPASGSCSSATTRPPCPSSGARKPSAPDCRKSSRPSSATCTPTSSCGKAASWPGCPPFASSVTPSTASAPR